MLFFIWINCQQFIYFRKPRHQPVFLPIHRPALSAEPALFLAHTDVTCATYSNTPALSAGTVHSYTDSAAHIPGPPTDDALPNINGPTTNPNILSPRPVSSSILSVSHAPVPLSPSDSMPSPPGPDSLQPATPDLNQAIFKPKIWPNASIRYPFPFWFCCIAQSDVEPTCCTQASRSLEWKQAMIDEFNALLRHGAWFLVPDSPNCNTVGWKCIFKVKRRFDALLSVIKPAWLQKCFTNNPKLLFRDL